MLTPSQFRRAAALFLEAREATPEDRSRLLELAAAEDAEVASELRRLLDHDGSVERQMFDTPFEFAVDGDPGGEPAGEPGGGPARLGARDTPDEPAQSERIGPYKILARLGEGGMGVVYLAQQKEPMRRRVALKVIKLGMDSRQVLRRFETERQSLALMEHPNIARVYDCGTTGRGQPYFAMEYVKGLPITKYCDDLKLSVVDRLELFRQVCSGVQHAHQKGIVHRDLTPNNVLVSVQEGEPRPKIIDFGLARATDRQHIGGTLYTRQGQIIGTPEYMSPEQAGLDGLDVDTCSDIYTLGVLLYELLVGELPFSRSDLEKATLLEVQRMIREDDPPRPSTRLTTLGDASAAARRRTDTRALSRRLQGDLDWIVMKALEKDRTRRYPTAIALAEDLQRHLDDQPVLAGPPSAAYRFRKFVRRYRGRVVAGAMFVGSLLVGIAGTTYFMIEAREQEALARESESRAHERAEEARSQRERADREAAKANAARVIADARAVAEAEARSEAVANLEKFNLLANVVNLREARARAASLFPAWPDRASAMREWIDEQAAPLERTLPKLRQSLDELRERGQRDAAGNWTFAARGEQFLHDTLARLVTDLDAFVDPTRGEFAAVRERLDWAATIAERSITEHEARWNDARRSILRADGVVASELYADRPIELVPQIGLVPIGMNPRTRLWEFYHLRSGAPGHPIPTHDADGAVDVCGDTGIVFVLSPGGTFVLGAQSDDPDGPGYDRFEQPNAEVHEVEIAPFFMARHELTQAQWERLSRGEDPSGYARGRTVPGQTIAVTGAHPVEQVSWPMCDDLLRRHGLTLPTEAQWEFACRAASTTPWSTGAVPASLDGFANVADATAERFVPSWSCEEAIDDGYVIHAPVGSFRANPFGLFDVHGNVWEWCRDAFGPAGARVLKGGSFVNPARFARSAARNTAAPGTRSNNLGVRASRELTVH